MYVWVCVFMYVCKCHRSQWKVLDPCQGGCIQLAWRDQGTACKVGFSSHHLGSWDSNVGCLLATVPFIHWTVSQAFNLCTHKSEASSSLWVWDQSGIQSEFQDSFTPSTQDGRQKDREFKASLQYKARLCIQTNKNQLVSDCKIYSTIDYHKELSFGASRCLFE